MAAQQQNITLAAPGFAGINTEISPTEQGGEFASIADNCVIDHYGRIASRKGLTLTTTNSSAFGGTHNIESMHEHLTESDTKIMFGAANNKLWKGEAVPADVTPGGATITANNWQMVTFNDDMYAVQVGHTPIQYKHSTTTVAEIAAIPKGNCVMGAYGRLWVAGVSGLESVVYWSDLLDGIDFSAGSSGSIDVAEYWPRGYDTIQAIAAHNDFLIVFGKESILVYNGANGDPATNLKLSDSVNGMGCIARDTVANTGEDIYFLDNSGVRSFARTIQEKSMPIGNVSKNVRTETLERIANERSVSKEGQISAIYSPEEAFYLLHYPSTDTIGCFATKNPLQDGSLRTTEWTLTTSALHVTTTGRVILGGPSRYATYSGGTDNGEAFTMKYYSNPLTFGSSTNLKFPKQVDLTLLASAGASLNVLWAFDYGGTYRSKALSVGSLGTVSEYGVAEYNIATYSTGIKLDRIKANVGGSGVVVTIGIEANISNSSLSIQEINIQALLGRIV